MKRFAIVLALGSCVATAVAQDSPEQTYYFDCDTAEASFSEWSLEIIRPRVQISGTLELKKTRKHRKYIPAASFFVVAADKSFWTGIRVGWLHSDPTKSSVEMINQPTLKVPESIGRTNSPKSPIPFSVTFSEGGLIELQVANVTRTAHVPGDVPVRIGLSCSTAEVVFKSIRVN